MKKETEVKKTKNVCVSVSGKRQKTQFSSRKARGPGSSVAQKTVGVAPRYCPVPNRGIAFVEKRLRMW